MKAQTVVEVYSCTVSLTSALDDGACLTPRPYRFTARKWAFTHCTGGWEGPWAGSKGYRKCYSYRNSIPGPSSPQRVESLHKNQTISFSKYCTSGAELLTLEGGDMSTNLCNYYQVLWRIRRPINSIYFVLIYLHRCVGSWILSPDLFLLLPFIG
jgi:hypothetical protein